MKNKFLFMILSFVLLVTGCSNNESNALIVNCDGKEEKVSIKENTEIKCNLLGEDYTFKIKSVGNKNIKVNIDKFGLTTTSSLIKKQDEFTINKNEKVQLRTQSTDYQEYVYFIWK